jgi:hypothetical protein
MRYIVLDLLILKFSSSHTYADDAWTRPCEFIVGVKNFALCPRKTLPSEIYFSSVNKPFSQTKLDYNTLHQADRTSNSEKVKKLIFLNADIWRSTDILVLQIPRSSYTFMVEIFRSEYSSTSGERSEALLLMVFPL